MPPERKPLGPSPILVVALLVSLATGAAASLIIGAATASGGTPIRVTELVLPNEAIVVAILGFFGILLGFFVYQRLSGPAVGFGTRTWLNFLVVILILILFVVVFRSLLGGGPAPTGAVPTVPNPPGPPPPSNGTGTNLTPVGNVTPLFFPSLPGWVPFVLIAVAVLVGAVVGLPAIRAFVEERRASRAAPGARSRTIAEVRIALEQARQQLDLGDDPRRVIVALYNELLARLGPIVGGVDPETPEEIRSRHLLRLGIRPTAAMTLTRLFEEARYSSHPLGPGHREETRRAVREALADLTRTPEES